MRKSPSDEEKSYPIDIAVFKDGAKTEDNVFLIVERKKKTRKDGVAQLKLYMDMSRAEIGVWFNGEDHHYLRKIYQKNGGIASLKRASLSVTDPKKSRWKCRA